MQSAQHYPALLADVGGTNARFTLEVEPRKFAAELRRAGWTDKRDPKSGRNRWSAPDGVVDRVIAENDENTGENAQL